MANAVSLTVIQDGARNAILSIDGYLDTSNVTNLVIIDPAVLWPQNVNLPAQTLRVKRAQYKIPQGLDVRLLWDATSPMNFIDYVGSGHDEYTQYLPNLAGAGKTGKILLTTTGWASGVLEFSLLLEMVKARIPLDPAYGGLSFTNYQSSGLVIPLVL